VNTQPETKLSSNRTPVALYGSLLVCLIFIPVLAFVIVSQEFHIGIFVSLLAFVIVMGFTIYQFIYVSHAWIINNKLVLKKSFRPRVSYSFDRIGRIRSFQLKRTKYIIVEMRSDTNKIEKYIIINAASVRALENKNAEQTLLNLQKTAGNKK
jgi:hypothetical protein